MNELKLIPSYWASVSGGKDSLFMLKLILSNPERYPLNGVVHFELEIDYPFIKNVIDYMEWECKQHGIPFVRIRPRKTWGDLFYTRGKDGYIYGFPTRVTRWCNSQYKLDARKQLDEYMKTLGKYVVSYIGYCADEKNRFNKRKNVNEIYPLVDYGIYEEYILEWAKNVDIFNNYYLSNKRCGCMYCPLASRLTQAYLYKYYPIQFDYMINKMRETEKIKCKQYGRKSFSCISGNPKYNADYLENIIKTKWINKLNEIEKNEVATMRLIFTNDDGVDKYIDEYLEKKSYRPTMIYVIMRYGYTENELNKNRYQLEILEHDNYYDEYSWNNDWYEGQKFIEIAKIFTDDDILAAFGYN